MMAASSDSQVWDAFGGNQQAQKYSTATQITPDNVKDLKKAWRIHTGDVGSGAHETTWGATPLFVNDTRLYRHAQVQDLRGGARHRQGQVDL